MTHAADYQLLFPFAPQPFFAEVGTAGKVREQDEGAWLSLVHIGSDYWREVREQVQAGGQTHVLASDAAAPPGLQVADRIAKAIDGQRKKQLTIRAHSI